MLINRKDSREVMDLAWPTILGMVGNTLMGLVDAAMVGRLSAEALAATGLGNMLIWAFGSLVNAINVGVQTIVARRYGEQNYRDIGTTLHSSLLFTLTVGTLYTLAVLPALTNSFRMVNGDPAVISLGNDYMSIRIWGILPAMYYFALYGFFSGIGKTKVHLHVSVLSNTLNVILNYVLIFGKWGFPEMGIRGAALGTVIATAAAALIYFIRLADPALRQQYRIFRSKALDAEIMKKLFILSSASGLQNFFVLIGFSIFMIIIGKIGTLELAASNIVFTILSFSFMPGFGFGLAAGTLTGNYMGRNNIERAERLIKQSLILNIMFMGSMGILFILFPEYILRLFTADTAVIAIGALPLRILGIVQFIDAIGTTLMGALRGAGDTSYVAWVDSLLNWLVFLPLTYLLGITLKFGAAGAWSSFIIYLVAFAGLLLRRFFGGRWKSIRV